MLFNKSCPILHTRYQGLVLSFVASGFYQLASPDVAQASRSAAFEPTIDCRLPLARSFMRAGSSLRAAPATWLEPPPLEAYHDCDRSSKLSQGLFNVTRDSSIFY
ncbi:hypothetical protein BDV11DRAFT_190629 [Aspergillus similis]